MSAGTGDVNIVITEEGAETAARNLQNLGTQSSRTEAYLARLGDAMSATADEAVRLAEGTVKADEAMAAAADSAKAAAGGTDSLAASTGKADESSRLFTATLSLQGREITLAAESQAELNAQVRAYQVELQAASRQAEMLQAIQEKSAMANIEQTNSVRIASENMSPMYNNLTKLESIGTPAILKAATWTVLGVGGIAYEGIKQYMNFNKLITQTITQAGVNPNQRTFLTGLAENVAQMTGMNLNDVANTIYRVASGTASWNNGLGETKKQMTDLVKQTAQLEVLGNVSGGTASEQTARVMSAIVNADLRGVGHNPKKAAALLNAVVGASDMRMADLVPGLGRGLLNSARANNVSAQDAMAWQGVLTALGTTGSVAGNYVKTGINLLANPSAQGTAAMAMIGIRPGEIQGLLGSKGGLVSAIMAIRQGMKRLNPAADFTLGKKHGMGAAVSKLQTWLVGELSPQFLHRWEAGKLSAKQLDYAMSLIMTKAYGGSKQFATISPLLKSMGLLIGIENRINANKGEAHYNKMVAIAMNTPSQRFHKDLSSLQVDLVKAGQALYPVTIAIVDGFTKIIGVMTRFKPILLALAGPLAAIITMAAASKIGSLGRGIYSMLGGVSSLHGKMSTRLYNAGLKSFGKYAPGEFKDGKLLALDGSVMGHQSARKAYLMSSQESMAKLGESLGTLTGAVTKSTTASADSAGASNRLADVLLGKDVSPSGAGSWGGSEGSLLGSRMSGVEGGALTEEQRLTNFRKELGAVSTVPGLSGGAIGRMGAQVGPEGLLANQTWLVTKRSEKAAATAEEERLRKAASAEEARLREAETRRMYTSGEGLAQNTSYLESLKARAAGMVENVGTSEAGNVGVNLVGTEGGSMVGGLLSKITGSGIGGLLGDGLGMVSGPIGMMAMSMLMPMAMPYILSAGKSIFGALGSFFGTGGGTAYHLPAISGITTYSSNTSKIAALKKSIKALGYNPLTANRAETMQYDKLSSELTKAEGLAPFLNKNRFAAYQGAEAGVNNPILNKLMKATSDKAYNSYYGKHAWTAGSAAGIVPMYRKLVNSLPANLPSKEKQTLEAMLNGAMTGKGKKFGYLNNLGSQSFNALMRKTLARYQTVDSGVFGPLLFAAKMGVDPAYMFKHSTSILAAQGTIANQANWGNVNQNLSYKGLNRGNYSQREHDAQTNIKAFLHLAQLDYHNSAHATDTVSKRLYLNAAKKAAKEAGEFAVFSQGMKDKINHMKLHPQSITDLSRSVSNELKGVYRELKMDQTGMTGAFVAALNQSGKALASVVNRQNANAVAHHGG